MSARVSSRPPAARGNEDPLVGRVLGGKFTIEALIARGAMGKVYRANQGSLGRTCAVKVLTAPEGEGADGEFHQRFLREASIGARLTHPNTVTIFDYGIDGDLYFIAMELLEGRTLARLIREEGALDEVRATQIARQICRSLREAHTLGVVHRDLKPANVFLVERREQEEGDVVRVLDFGLVKRVEADPGDDLTAVGVFVGSPKYMAPEQIRGEHVDARADIYALGTILYELLTGHVPFERPKPVDTLLAQVNAKVPPLRDKKKDLEVDPRIEAMVMRCLEKSPDDRYASMEELLGALKLSGGAMTATMSLEALRASGAYGTRSSRPPAPLSISGEIPAAAPRSHAPGPSIAPRPANRWLPLALGGIALASIAGVLVVRGRDHRSSASTPVSTVAAATATSNAAPPVSAPPVASATIAPATSASAAPVPSAAVDALVAIDSEPTGARIRDLQRAILCDSTPCSVRVGKDGVTVIVDAKGHVDETVRLYAGDAPRVVKLTKTPTWQPPRATSAPPATATTPPRNNTPPPTIPTAIY
jgi:serine/threonine-protein kinase